MALLPKMTKQSNFIDMKAEPVNVILYHVPMYGT